MPRTRTLVRIGKGVLLLLWLVSLALPAGWNADGSPDWNDGTGPIPGFAILLVGWTGILDGTIGWFANPLFFIFLGKRMDGSGRWRPRMILAALLALTYASALSWRISHGADSQAQTPGGPGYYLWLAVIGIVTFWSLVAAIHGYRSRSRAGE